jgi:hypothetical protein
MELMIFFPFTNSNITSIASFIISDKSGHVIFQKFNLMAVPFNFQSSWDSTDGQGNILYSLFSFEITIVNVDNEEATFTGKVCSIHCQEGIIVVPSENTNNCGFARQHNGQVNLDLIESDCF